LWAKPLHMKYSQRIGILAAAGIMAVCFLPWSYIAGPDISISGFHAAGTNFGRPGLLNFVFCTIMLILYAVPAIWAKRWNVFVAAVNLAWSFRNYLLVTACMMGVCPEKKIGLYLLLFLSVVAQVMALLPKMPAKSNNANE
jgi:hypothetical protein